MIASAGSRDEERRACLPMDPTRRASHLQRLEKPVRRMLLAVAALAAITAPADAMSYKQWQNTPVALRRPYHSDLINEWARLDERCHPNPNSGEQPDAAACTALVMTINKLQAFGCGFGTADGWSCPPPEKVRR